MKIIRSILLLLVLVSCSSNLPSTDPDVGLLDELNQRIELSVPKAWNNFKTTDPVTVEITNISKDNIVFDANYGVRLFVQNGEHWAEVMDGLTSFYQDPILLQSYNGDDTTTGVVSVLPKLADRTKGAWLRIYVIGQIESKVGDEALSVGAYIDVFLNP